MRFSTVSRFLAVALSAFVSINEGAASSANDATLPSTQLHATVVFPDGTPASGAVVLTSTGGSAVADSEGRVRLEFDADAESSSIVVTAAATRNGAALSGSARVDGAGRDEIDAGNIVLDSDTPCEPDWLSTLGGAPGVNGSVRAIAFYDDGSGAGPQLHIAGQFTLAGSTDAVNIARWDGHEWRALGVGAGGTNATVYALAVFRAAPDQPEYLYAGGEFSISMPVSASRIARWDGQNWSRLWHSNPDGAVYTLCVHDDGNGPALYAGGQFLNIGSTVGSGGVARWDGVAWSRLNQRPPVHPVYTLKSFAGPDADAPTLYAGGGVTQADGLDRQNVVGWNGAWFPLGAGMSGAVRILEVYDDGRGEGPQLYAGGEFTTADGNPASRLARWNGERWLALHTGVNGTVQAMAVYRHPTSGEPRLYIAGDFTTAASGAAQRLARWDAPHLIPIPQAFSSRVYTLHATGDPGDPDARLLAGGSYSTVQGAPARSIASWDAQSWKGFGEGFPAPVHAMQRYADSLIVGGAFLGASGLALNHIGDWNGLEWRSLSTGVNGPVFAMTVLDQGNGESPSLIVGGNFTIAGPWGAQRVARWDGQNWFPMGLGMANAVRALAVFDDGLGGGPAVYAAGEFVVAGGMLANRIARWDGITWVPVGQGFNNTVNALGIYTDPLSGTSHLYAGGRFTMSGETAVSGIARWDGVSWSPVGGGVTSNGTPEVFAFQVYDAGLGDGPALFVGGSFTHAGGVSTRGIARWDGVEWHALPSTFLGPVHALSLFSDGVQKRKSLAVGGSFTLANGIAESIALWDGVSWQALGVEPIYFVRSLAFYAGPYGARQSLYIGGTFTDSPAGDSYLTRWQGCERDTACPGDTNADGLVNFADLNAVLSTFGQTGDALPGDVNADGVVNFADLNTVILNMGLACP